MPTVLRVLGLSIPARLQGRDLAVPDMSAIVFSESYPSFSEQAWLAGTPRDAHRAAVSWPIKLVVRGDGVRQLFNSSSDPDESRDLASSHPDLVTRLEAALAAGLPGDAEAKSRHPVPAEVRDRLRALGYLK